MDILEPAGNKNVVTGWSRMSSPTRCFNSQFPILADTFMSQVTNTPPLTSIRIWDWDQRTEHLCA